MNIIAIKELIKKGESEVLEFKKSTAQLTAAMETICGFLNGKGGKILIGVTNEGKIIGQNVTDNTRQEIANHIAKIEPSAQSQINIEYIPIENKKDIIFIKIEQGNHIPYTYDGRPFHRSQSTTSKMSQHGYEQLLVKRGQLNHSWEDLLASDHTIADLNEDLVRKIIKLAIQNGRLEEGALNDNLTDILEKFQLIKNGMLTRAAIILFCKKENRQFIQSQLRLARFRGIDKNEFIDNKQYLGNVFYLYDQAMNFLRNYLPIEGKIIEGDPKRADNPAIPYKALREAIVNALCHRDYGIGGGAVSIAIYDDRIEINNIGTLPQEINIRRLSKPHPSIPRNPNIAKVFYIAGYIEMWGRGTQNILVLSKEAGNPEPKFIATESDFTVCFPLRENIISGAATIQLSSRQAMILKILSNNDSMKVSDITSNFTKISYKTIQRELLFLQKNGFVVSLGKGRNTTWKIIDGGKSGQIWTNLDK